jgi:hypothetical protein
VVAWHRGPIRRSAGAPAAEGPRADEAPAAVLPVSHLKGEQLSAKVLYPPAGRAATAAEWQPDAGELVVRLPRVPSACLVALGQDPGSVPVERLDATGAPLTDKQRARTDRKAGWQ